MAQKNSTTSARGNPSASIPRGKRLWLDAFDAMPDPIFMHDRQGRIVHANRAFSACAGIELAEARRRRYWEIFPDLAQSPLAHEVVPAGVKVEQKLRLATGKVYAVYGRALHDARSRYRGGLHFMVDITEHEQRELDLWSNERAQVEAENARLASIVESTQDAIISRSVDGTITSWNPGAERLYGYSAAEAIGRHISFIMPPDRMQERAENWRRLSRGEAVPPYETVRITKDGRHIDVSLSLSPIKDAAGNITGIAIVTHDISPLKQVEAALRSSEARLRTIFDSEPECVKIVSAEGCLLDMNHAGLAMLEVDSIVQAQWHGLMSFVAPADRPRMLALLQQVGQGESGELEFEIIGLKGTHRHVHSHAVPFQDENRSTPAILAITRDVTQRKAAERARANLAAIVENSNEAIISRSLDGTVRSWNAGAERMLGYSAKEAIGRSITFILPPGQQRNLERNSQRILRGEVHPPHESRRVTKDGRVIDVLVSHSAIRNDRGDITGASVIIQDISAVKQAETALKESEERFRAAFEQAGVGMALRTLDARSPWWVRVNQKLCDMLGYTREELLKVSAFDLTPPEDIAVARDYHDRLLRGEITSYVREKRYVRKDGRIIWVSLALSLVRGVDGRPLNVISVIEDISERKRSEEELRLASEAFAATADGIMITDAAQRIVSINKAFTRITGYAAEEVLGKTPRILRSGRHDESFYRDLWNALTTTGNWQGEVWNRRRSGDAYPELLTISAVRNAAGETSHYVGVFNDISPLKEYEARLKYLAHHDALTGLPTRSLLRDRIEVAISQSARERRRLALLFIDLDRFKLINDSLGHEIGDRLLEAVSVRLRGALRVSDTVSRHGGDEFLVLLPAIDSVEDVGRVCEKLVAETSASYHLDRHELIVTASIGIAIYPENGADMDTLLRNADAAMYAAKQAGRSRYQFYSEDMNAQANERLTLEHELRHALERGELYAVYQPQIELATQRVVGVEALIRWDHPKLQTILPERFITVAEESGQIMAIGDWMLRQVCAQQREWQRRGLLDVPISVNVSAIQFRQANFVATVHDLLQETNVAAADLEIEVTESVLMHGAETMITKLQQLSELGVRVAIDDFGTGYSSLSYLRQLPLDRIKIDQSFVRDLPGSADAGVIAQAIASLGRSLGLRVTAEGVEEPAQAEFLRRNACHDAQGFLYCEPLRPAQLEKWLAKWQARPVVASR
jgi:diguanylate cyclase (GGDEF)-like protein/PAS domain S-box-containing protein